MIIDFNSIAKGCWQNLYNTDNSPNIEDIDKLVEDNIYNLIQYVSNIEVSEGYNDFKQNLVESLKTVLILAYLKNINLNDYFKLDLNLS